MSAQRSQRDRTPAQPDLAYRRPRTAHLRARRRAARRATRLARLDLGLGVLAAIVLLLVSPGLAITFLVAVAILAACTVSIVRDRRRARRSSARGARRDRRRTGQRRARRAAPGRARAGSGRS